MAMLHGKGGSVTWGGAGTVPGEVINWSLDATADVAETTNMSTVTWKTYLAGFSDWTASVECKWDTADTTVFTALSAGPSTLTLEMVDAGHNIESTAAICTGVSMNTDMGDIVSVSYSFQGSGALAYGAA